MGLLTSTTQFLGHDFSFHIHTLVDSRPKYIHKTHIKPCTIWEPCWECNRPCNGPSFLGGAANRAPWRHADPHSPARLY